MKRTRRRIAPNTFPSQSDPGQATPAKRLRPSDPDKNSPDETPQRLMTSPKATGHRPQASPKAIRAASLESSRSPDPPPVNNRPKNLSKSKIIQKIHKTDPALRKAPGEGRANAPRASRYGPQGASATAVDRRVHGASSPSPTGPSAPPPAIDRRGPGHSRVSSGHEAARSGRGPEPTARRGAGISHDRGIPDRDMPDRDKPDRDKPDRDMPDQDTRDRDEP